MVTDDIQEIMIQWHIANRIPDSIILPENKYRELIDYINRCIPITSHFVTTGQIKYMGLDVVVSFNVDKIRLAITKP